jgi:salicylate hydroxylase
MDPLTLASAKPIYPTRSLRFLEKLEQKQSSQDLREDIPEPAKLKLKIIICGAGLGGLATAVALARRGHKVTCFEQAPQLGEVGAGIQIPSNSSRLLLKWGLGPHLRDHVVEPSAMSFRRWQTGEVIGLTKLVPNFTETYDAPYFVIHRAHFHKSLHTRAVELGVDVRIGCKVVKYDVEAASITLEDGSKHFADLVVAADGS